jgi:L-amino acid N-acyltransferase YncA
MLKITQATEADFAKIWPIFQDIVQNGRTFVYRPDISFDEAKTVWFDEKFATYIASVNGEVVGAYVIRPGHRDLGSHIANAAYIIAFEHRGKGYGEDIARDSFVQAKELGFKAMQFNYVISTNKVAVALWQKLGFNIVGTVPKAYQHKELGLVDIHIMHKYLDWLNHEIETDGLD